MSPDELRDLTLAFHEYLYRVSSQVPFEHAQWAQERGSALLEQLKVLAQQASPAAPPCRWPLCQPEEVQQRIAKEVVDALYGDPVDR